MNRRELIQLGLASPLMLNTPGLFAGTGKGWNGYEKAIVIDGLSAAFDSGTDHINDATMAVFRNSGVTAVNATIPYPGDDYDATNIKIKHTIDTINKYPKDFRLIKSVEDILQAKKQKQIGIIMGFQSTEMFDDELTRIDEYAKQGVRYMQMSYNRRSQFGDGGLESSNKGLTKLGKKAIELMQASGVLVDLSHSGQQTTREAIEFSRKPITISHTGCNAIYKHPRNNDDAELKMVAEKGGVVGVYLMPFLQGGEHEIKGDMVMKHIQHAINVCGIDHVSIGTDQGIMPVADGPEYREKIRQEVNRRIAAGISAPGETPNRPPFIVDFNTERRFELMAVRLKKMGLTDGQIEKILGVNLLNLYKETW